MEVIRHIATALNRDDLAVLGEAEKRIWLMSLDPPAVKTSFDTVLDFGGERLALCTPGDRLVVVAAAWERHGVCAYDGKTGDRLWQRNDLKRVHRLAAARDGGYVAASLDRRSMQVLDATTGETAASVRGADGYWQSRHGALAVTSWYQQVTLLDTDGWIRQGSTPVQGFAILDVGFAPDGLIVSDSSGSDAGGSVYAFSLSGKLLWRREQPSGMLCWAVEWDERSDEWIGLRHHVDRTAPDAIVRWSRTGEITGPMAVESVVDGEFLPGGRQLVTTTSVVDAQTGKSLDLPVGSSRS